MRRLTQCLFMTKFNTDISALWKSTVMKPIDCGVIVCAQLRYLVVWVLPACVGRRLSTISVSHIENITLSKHNINRLSDAHRSQIDEWACSIV